MALTGRRRRLLPMGMAALSSLALTACAAILGIDAPIPDELYAAGDATSAETSGSIDGGGEATASESSVDVADGAVADVEPPCKRDAGFPSNGTIFVGPSGEDTDNCGSKDEPCKTIQKGLERVAGVGDTVLVARGVYQENITLTKNVTIQGGWEVVGRDWGETCITPMRDAVVIQPPNDGAATAVSALDLAGTATLSRLTVRSKAVAAPGESLYGIFARGAGTTVVLDDVAVIAESGGAGVSGSTGAVGSDADGGCTPGAGVTPGQAATGAGADGGVFTVNGFDASIGVVGAPGTKGANGSQHDAGCVACRSCGTLALCTNNAAAPSCGTTPTTAGCGGAGGTGAGPGQSGGSSLGIYAWSARVLLSGGTTVTAGSGGSGGAGGTGGAGGQGGPGTNGNPGTVCSTVCMASLDCVAATGSGSAGHNDPGAMGGQGGTGGGGAGGHAFAIVRGADAGVDAGDASLAHGDGGTSFGNGATGSAGDYFP